jgi:hypothetical protein
LARQLRLQTLERPGPETLAALRQVYLETEDDMADR